jgi:hypothetical protein
MPDDLDAVVKRTRRLEADNAELRARLLRASGPAHARRAPPGALSTSHWVVLVLFLLATAATVASGGPTYHVLLKPGTEPMPQ